MNLLTWDTLATMYSALAGFALGGGRKEWALFFGVCAVCAMVAGASA